MRCLLIITFILFSNNIQAQEISYQDLNSKRLQTNKTGMTILTTWGAANVVAGTTGFIIADDEEWESFHLMNAMWGAVNTTIGVLGYIGTKKEMREQMNYADALQGYEADKRLFLLNAGLDVAYIGTGLVLDAYADNFDNPAEWRGFGKSISFQGIALLLFDGTMFAIHSHQNKSWYKILEGVTFTGNSVGFRYTF